MKILFNTMKTYVWFVLIFISIYATAEELNSSSKEPKLGSILVSTIDGKLQALNFEDGSVKWIMKEEPVLRSPSNIQQGFTFIPNPSDGSLYTLKDSTLKKLPFNMQQLVQLSPCKGNDGILYAGSKKDSWFGIDPTTGRKVETISSANAERICPANQETTVFLGRTEYHLSMFHENDRARRWNATFNDYSAHLLPGNNDYPLKHFVSSSTGTILAVDKTKGDIVWEQDLKAPIVALYLLEKDGLHKLPFSVMGKETIENIVKSIYSMDQWPSIISMDDKGNAQPSSVSNSLYPSLYVGESSFGLYAIDAYIDHQTIAYSPKLLGPPLLEGPAPIALTDEEKENYLPPRRPIVSNVLSVTYKTIHGEYLLLGYHDPPSIILESVITSRIAAPNYWQINDFRQISGPEPQKTIEYIKEEEVTFGRIVMQIYMKYPAQFYGLIITVFVLIGTVIWMCGHQWGRSTVNSMYGAEVQTSRQSSSSMDGFRFRENFNIPDGWMAIGKVLYNPSDILGRGCEGTVVYRGRFEGREVAVKRVVSEFVKFAHREADLLRESDAHQHVIRYFCMEVDSQFRYLALELCLASVNEYVEHKEVKQRVNMKPVDILMQATSGLLHLHSSKIVHRDIKPQNILITMPSHCGVVRIVISDFGLCKRVQPGKNSLSRGLASGLAGTDGWIAPEALISERTSYPVDIFSLGCIFYYVLSNGDHPFGKSLHRQANIVNNSYSLSKISALPDFNVVENLISSMIAHEPEMRPKASCVLNDPMFWAPERRLNFLADVSDRVEKEEDGSPIVRRLENNAKVVLCGGWREKICDALSEDLRKFRTYKTYSVRDLLRAMRNKKHHYRELPANVQNSLGDIPDQFLNYFTSRFPKLFLHVYKSAEYCCMETIFKPYYSDMVRNRMKPIIEEEERMISEIKEEMSNEVWVRAKFKKTPNTDQWNQNGVDRSRNATSKKKKK